MFFRGNLEDTNSERNKSSLSFQSSAKTDNILVQFCKETSLTGIKYFAEKDRHVLEKLFWLMAYASGLVIAGILIHNVWHKAGTNPIFLAFSSEDIQIGKIPFPAITICNVNRVRKSVVLEIQRDAKSTDENIRLKAEQELKYIKSICSAKASLIQKIRKSASNQTKPAKSVEQNATSVVNIIDLLYMISQPCGEMIKYYFAGPMEIPVEQEFHPVVTETGLCCTSNMLPPKLLLNFPEIFEPSSEFLSNETTEQMNKNIELWSSWKFKNGFLIMEPPEIAQKPRRQFKQGKSFGMSMLLYPDLENYYCTSGDHVGFKLILHSPLEMPHPFEYGTAIPVNSEIYQNVLPQLTISKPGIAKVNISYRKCYFPDEFPLKYFKAYTDANCIDECSSNYTFKDCGCVQYYQLHENTTRLCGESDRNCTKTLAANAARGKTRCSHCYPLCNEIDYHMETSVSELQDYSMLWPMNDTTKPDWVGKPISILNLFYGERTTVPRVRNKLFETTDLIGSIGGLLGLCLGVSGLSVTEILYFCSLRPWFQKKSFTKAIKGIGRKLMNGIKKIIGGNEIKTSTKSNQRSQNLVGMDIGSQRFSVWEVKINKNELHM